MTAPDSLKKHEHADNIVNHKYRTYRAYRVIFYFPSEDQIQNAILQETIGHSRYGRRILDSESIHEMDKI